MSLSLRNSWSEESRGNSHHGLISDTLSNLSFSCSHGLWGLSQCIFIEPESKTTAQVRCWVMPGTATVSARLKTRTVWRSTYLLAYLSDTTTKLWTWGWTSAYSCMYSKPSKIQYLVGIQRMQCFLFSFTIVTVIKWTGLRIMPISLHAYDIKIAFVSKSIFGVLTMGWHF